ncbi:hypothetical protein [Sneathiella sp. HT1-7]|uniref:hypothetical protein n=1 Tax=Sneathiella sp. HT1-7 TaxID=2887192 RepID=UPI001D15AC55|nr:hypothetical protein [Sneathiella sp. HT1-7]MCC3303379.1 hypothetical protein [Sneathiella sp. HT1-7]
MAKSSKTRLPIAYARPQSTRQRRSFLKFFELAMTGNYDLDRISRIVSSLSYLTGYSPPRWTDLTSSEKFVMEQIVGHFFKINFSITFNISDEQQQNWISKHKNLTIGFKKEILHKVRHILGKHPTYWLVVEPKVSRGKKAKEYVDRINSPRRFDIHAGFLVDKTDLDRFQQGLSKRAAELKLKTPKPSGALLPKKKKQKIPYPLFLKGKMVQGAYIVNIGWATYSSKAIALTKKMHTDLTGPTPFGKSRNLTHAAKAAYEQIRIDAAIYEIPKPLLADLEKLSISPTRKFKRTHKSLYEPCQKLLDNTIAGLDKSLSPNDDIEQLEKISHAGKAAVINWAIDQVTILALGKTD